LINSPNHQWFTYFHASKATSDTLIPKSKSNDQTFPILNNWYC